MILHLKWMGIINTNQIEETELNGEGFCLVCTIKVTQCTYVEVIY